MPQWQGQHNTINYIALNCDNTSLSIHKTAIATVGQVAKVFDIEPGISDVTLCTKHYKIVHRHIHSNDYMYYPIVKCKMCQALIHGTVRHCADKVTLEAYYYELGCEITIEENYKICTNCYNHQLQIIKLSEDYSGDEELQVVVDNLHISVH